MISVSAPTFDINGHIISQQGAAVLQTASRRAKRVATLDLGAVLVDGGWSDADLTFKITISNDPGGIFHRAIQRMMQSHSTAILSCSHGCYIVLLSSLQSRKAETTVTAEALEVV